MKITIRLDGKDYESVTEELKDGQTLSEYTDNFRSTFNSVVSFSMRLKNGGFIVLFKDSIQRAVFLISDA